MSAQSMTVQEVLNRTQKFFKEKGIETARLDAELLLSHSLGWPRMNLYTKFDYPLGQEELSGCRELVRRRSQGEPVAYILEKKAFYNHDFYVNSNVLIPRPDTEVLVEKVLEELSSRKEEELHIADFGSGSGCIGLSLLKELPNSQLTAVDVSKEAIAVAQKNAENLELQERCHWLVKDVNLLGAKDMKNIDVVVANPPYIDHSDSRLEEDVKNHEPELALFAEDQGMKEICSWTLKAQCLLSAGGLFFCETGDEQKDLVIAFLKENNLFEQTEFYQDLAGRDRGFLIRFS